RATQTPIGGFEKSSLRNRRRLRLRLEIARYDVRSETSTSSSPIPAALAIPEDRRRPAGRRSTGGRSIGGDPRKKERPHSDRTGHRAPLH
ncbi:hypothetical protein ACJRO7_021544, partial [Eucalyptus globulus]